MKNKKLITTLVASALTLTSLIRLGASAFAADSTTTSPTTTAKVPTAAQIAQNQADGKAAMTAQLDAAVKVGTITQAQEDLTINFFATHKPGDPASEKNLTDAQRKTLMDQRKAEVEAFAKANNIPLDVLKPAGGHGGPGMGGTGIAPAAAS